jgi:CHC2 zinc finger
LSSYDFEGAIVAIGSAQTREDIQEVIKRIKETIDLASYVGKFVVLKKEGGSLKGLCPFHEERSPSFSINQKSGGQFFHCFGCGKSGDIIDFVAGYDDCTVGEAIRKLRAGEDVAVRPMVQKPVEPIQIPTTSADKLQAFHQRLMASETGEMVLKYLAKRGISRKTASYLQLGLTGFWKAEAEVQHRMCNRLVIPVWPNGPLPGSDSQGYRLKFIPDISCEPAQFPEEHGKAGETMPVIKSWCSGPCRTMSVCTKAGRKIAWVVEGESDLLTATELLREDAYAWQVVWPITGTNGCGGIPEEWIDPGYWAQFEMIILSYDRDKAGYEAAKRFIDLNLHYDVRYCPVQEPFNDLNAQWQSIFRTKPKRQELRSSILGLLSDSS